MIGVATTRPAEPRDAEALAALHAAAWRYAYRGIIPGLALERMIARRGPAWWAARPETRGGTLLLEFDGRIAGYATFGPTRIGGRPRMGEIFELYVEPECHGAGFGRLLFVTARGRLAAAGLKGLVIWALTENTLARGFYAAMGGRERFRTAEQMGGARLAKIAYLWP
jgi:GNAT superfamily N-acetyltransferase